MPEDWNSDTVLVSFVLPFESKGSSMTSIVDSGTSNFVLGKYNSLREHNTDGGSDYFALLFL